MHIKTSFWNKKYCFKSFHFNNVPIKKPRIKHLKLHELQLYDINFIIFHFTKLSIKQISKAFKGYAKRYKIKIIDSKDALVQLEASKSSMEDLKWRYKICSYLF